MRPSAWLSLLALGCGPTDSATNDAECRAAEACQAHGRCTFHRGQKKCVVGSSEDCAGSRICQKENRCRKVGEICGSE